MVTRNLKIKYRRSFFGFFWTLLVPLGLASVYYVVFQKIMKIGLPNYLIFVLSGVLPWNFFAQTIGEGTSSVVNHSHLLTKVPVPVQIFPWVGVVTNLVTLVLGLPVLFLIVGVQLEFNWNILFLGLYLAALFILTYNFALMACILFVFFRDLQHAIGIILSFWFYATPVLYHADMIPENFKWVLYANPVSYVFIGFRRALLEPVGFVPEEFLVTSIWMLVSTLLAYWALRRLGPVVTEYL